MSSMAPFVPEHPKSYGSLILHQMAEFQQTCVLTDFILSSEGQEIHCHRTLLAIACPYFSAMFRSGMKEAEERKAAMDTVDFPILKYAVDFMYGKSPSMLWGDVDKLVEACELLQLNGLKKQLDIYIAYNLTAENCIPWWKNCEKFYLEVTGAKAKSIMISEFQNVSKSEDFMELMYAELVNFVHTVEESVSNRDQVLYAMIGWVSGDKAQRKSLMMDILKVVKLAECSSGAINSVTKTQSDLFTEPDVMRLVYNSFLPKLEENESKLKSLRHQNVIVLGGMSEYNGQCYTKCWQWSVSFANSSWRGITNIPNAVIGKRPSFVCIPNGFVVMCGGEKGTTNAMYDTKWNIWTELLPTPEKLTDTVALYMDGKVHVLDGGKFIGSVITDKMYTFNLENLKWNRGPYLLEKQYHPIATAYDQALWVVYNDGRYPKSPCTFQLLAPKAHKWEYKASLPTDVKTDGACLVGYDNNLFLLVGCYNMCARYTISTDQWTKMASRPSVCHKYGCAFVLDQKIFLCGGGWNGSVDVTNCIEEYDPEADHWTVAKNKLPNEMIFFTACSVSGDTAN